MNNKLSRLLALLLSVVLLVSGTAAAFAEGVNEVGNVNDIEEMVFERVKELFPESDNEQRYLFISYYENDSAAKADALLATLADEERIAFIDWRAENGKCIEGCGGASGCTVIDCACLCHKVEEFNRNMDAFIDSLESLDMDEAIKFIAELRMDELEAYWDANYRPVVTAGAPGYDEWANAPDVMMLSSEEDDGTISDPETFSSTLNTLIDNADASTLDNPAKDSVLNVANTYSAVGASLEDTYGEGTDASNYLSNNQVGAFSLMRSVDAALTGNTEDTANMYLAALAADTVDPISTKLERVTAGVSTSDGIKVDLFNYNKSVNREGKYLKFSQGDGYRKREIEGYTGKKEVDLTENQGSIAVPVMYPTTDADGYPQASNVVEGSIAALFKDGSDKEHWSIDGGSGLFWKEGDYFVYDSSKYHAYFNQQSKSFELYNGIVRPWYYVGNTTDYVTTDAGEIPTKTVDGETISVYKKKESVSGEDLFSDISAGNFLPFNNNSVLTDMYGVSHRYLVEQPDLWFGLRFEGDLYMPKNGIYKDNAMEFQFLGDDDVWVYIDDVLILDISGTHAAFAGSIDFSTGVVKFKRNIPKAGTDIIGSGQVEDEQETTIKKLFINALDSNDPRLTKLSADSNTFKDYVDLNLKVYYLERGGNISYARFKFNLPILPPGGLTVGKEVNNLTKLTDVEYEFKIEVEDGKGGWNPVTHEGYTIVNGGDTKYTTDDDGIFKLKAGQMVHFAGLASQKTYHVTELTHDYTEETTWYVGSESMKSWTVPIYINPEDDTSAVIHFTNEVKKTSVTVEKKIEKGRVSDPDREFTYTAQVLLKNGDETDIFKLAAGTYNDTDNGTSYVVDANGTITFTLKQDQKVKISDLPIGATVEITESADNIAEYTMTALANALITDVTTSGYVFTGVLHDETTDAEPTVVITNTPNVYPLTISKDGLNLDADPNSSTMYRVECGDTGVNMVVAINGNGSVTIDNLPVGTYTVTELTNWSWRYQNTNDVQTEYLDGKDDSDSAKTDRVDFANTRNKIYWLDGENWAENVMDGTTVNATFGN